MRFNRFSDFGKELRRPFEVHENCYDCGRFYDGCGAWPAARDFACGVYNPLPDVMPGTCGQRFPATVSKLTTLGGGEAKPISADTSATKMPAIKPKRSRERRCGCGSPLPKGKRLCDGCRIQNRRRTKRDYMQTYREQRRSAGVDAGSGVPATRAGGLFVDLGGSDLPPGVFG